MSVVASPKQGTHTELSHTTDEKRQSRVLLLFPSDAVTQTPLPLVCFVPWHCWCSWVTYSVASRVMSSDSAQCAQALCILPIILRPRSYTEHRLPTPLLGPPRRPTSAPTHYIQTPPHRSLPLCTSMFPHSNADNCRHPSGVLSQVTQSPPP